MGKRKKITDHNKNPPPSDSVPYSSHMDSFSNEISSNSVGTSSIKPMSSLVDVMDKYVKPPSQSTAHHHSRTILVKHPRHYYGRQYSRRNSAYRTDASSHGTCTPLHDEKLSFKLVRQGNSESSWRAESREKPSRRLERTRPGTSTMNVISADVMKMICGICNKQLKSRSYILGNTVSSTNLSVVAVLVCGHMYHADCLETKTSSEDRRDPPCPTCINFDTQN